MAVKASATITLSFMVDIQAVYRYYLLQSSTAAVPTVPTTNPPSGWDDAEPSYTNGSTNTLYFVDLTVFTDDSYSYSAVSKSSSYEAAKEAYNKAQAATDAVNDLISKMEVIVGTQTSATGAWTGIASFSSLVDGQQITYWLPYAGSGSATLNLTLSDGSTTGAIPCYYNSTTRLTTHYAAGNVIRFLYRENVTINTTTIAKGWWADANYDSNTYDRVRLNNAITAKSAITAGRLIVGDDSGFYHLAADTAFDVTKPILYAGSAINASATGSNNYLSYPSVNLRNNLSNFTGTNKKTCYLVGTLAGNTFTPNSSLFTTTEPSSEDGLVYIALGLMISTYQIYLYPEHPIYRYVNGSFKSTTQIAYEAQNDINDLDVGGTNILRNTNKLTALSTSSSWSNGTWRSAGGGTGTRSVIDISDAPNGDIEKGIQIVGDNTDSAVAQDKVPVTIGKEYTMSCYAKGTGAVRLQVGKSSYSSAQYTLNDVATWTKYSFTFVAGDGNGASDGNTNVYFTNRGTGTLQMCGFKMETGNKATDWTPSPNDVKTDIDNAAKTATNYMKFTAEDGLIIGDHTVSTLGNNVLINSNSVNIRNGTTVLASFESNRITLGNNNADSVIDLCNGAGTITVIPSENGDSYPLADNLILSSRALDIVGERFVATGSAVRTDENIIGEVYVQGDCARLTAGIEYTGSESRNSSKVGVSALPSDTSANGRLLLYASERAKGDIDSVVTENQVNIYPSYTNFSKKIKVGGVDITGVEVQDSGWKTATLGSDFTIYTSGENVKYRKIGKIVEVNGVVKPTAAIAGSTTNYTIFTLPTGYRPHRQVSYRCQGSGGNSWLFTITAAGAVRFARYGTGATYVEAGTGTWLPFNATFFVD